MDKTANLVIGLIIAVALFFLSAWIFQIVYNSAVPALMGSTGSMNLFRPINYFEALAIFILLMIVGGAFSTKIVNPTLF